MLDYILSAALSVEEETISLHIFLCQYIDSTELERSTEAENSVKYHQAWHKLCKADGILVPGGFGIRGTEGKLQAISWARTKKKPFLGVCLGMQLAVVEFARNCLNWEDANSTEFDPDTKYPVVSTVFFLHVFCEHTSLLKRELPLCQLKSIYIFMWQDMRWYHMVPDLTQLKRYFLLVVSCHCLFSSVNCLSFIVVIFLIVSLSVNSCWEQTIVIRLAFLGNKI